MALLFCDSFDHYVNLGDKYDTVTVATDGASLTIESGAARESGGQGLAVRGGSIGSMSINKVFPATSKVTVGFAFQAVQANASLPLFSLNDDTNQQIYALVLTTGQIQIGYNPFVQSNEFIHGTTWGTSSSAVPFGGTWNFLEFQIVMGTAGTGNNGSIIVRINGITVLSLSGLDTAFDNTPSVNNITIGYPYGFPSSGDGYNIDDLYVCDGNGTVNNTFLGDVHVVALYPTGPGESTQWTPTGAAANWECVDDVPPNDGTTFISTSTVGAKDMYTLGSLPNQGTIHGIMVSSYSTKDQPGGRTLTHNVKDTISGNEIASGQVAPGTSFHFLTTPFDLDPSGNNWSFSEVNAMQAGVEVAS
jgi:hypothetical protein